MRPNNTHITPDVVTAIEHILEYLYYSERSDYENAEPHEKENHIFISLMKVSDWLTALDSHL